MTRDIIAAVLALILMTAVPVSAQIGTESDSVLKVAEAFFKAMKQKDYVARW